MQCTMCECASPSGKRLLFYFSFNSRIESFHSVFINVAMEFIYGQLHQNGWYILEYSCFAALSRKILCAAHTGKFGCSNKERSGFRARNHHHHSHTFCSTLHSHWLDEWWVQHSVYCAVICPCECHPKCSIHHRFIHTAANRRLDNSLFIFCCLLSMQRSAHSTTHLLSLPPHERWYFEFY